MKFKVKSQLDHMEKGGILDDCGPSSTAAAVAWAAGYEIDPSAADGIAAKFKATGQVDKQGVADNGSSLAQLIKTARVLGAEARFAKSWDDVVASAKAGAGIGVWVQQPVGYPAGVEISAWHEKWKKWYAKKDPAHLKAGYGHMTAAAWDAEEGWQWACPTRSGKGAEAFAVKVTEEQLKQIADSKRVSGKDKGLPHKHCIIITYKRKAAVPAPAPSAVPAPVAPAPAAPADPIAPKPAAAPVAKAVETPKPAAPAEVKAPRNYPKFDMPDFSKVDWDAAGNRAAQAFGLAAAATSEVKNPVKRLVEMLKWAVINTKVDEALLDAVRSFILVSISVALGLGIPILDLQGGDFRVIVSAGLAAGLQTLVKFLDPDQTKFGVTK